MKGIEMAGMELVFIGIDVVADALDTAERRRWQRIKAPRGLWRRLGCGTGVVLRHADAPLALALTPADSSIRGVCEESRGRFRVRMDDALFHELVEDCPVVEALVEELLASDSAVQAA